MTSENVRLGIGQRKRRPTTAWEARTPVEGVVEYVSSAGDRLLHPLLAARWSPTTFAASAPVSVDEVESLLEAARWAPSAGNSQPWAFIVGRRADRRIIDYRR